jgi:hypothetical protein
MPIRIPLHSLLFLFNDLALPSISSKSLRFRSLLFSIPTAPTIHLSDGWTLNKITWGQKGADWADDPVPFFFLAARVTTGGTNFIVQSIFPRTPVLAGEGHLSNCARPVGHKAESCNDLSAVLEAWCKKKRPLIASLSQHDSIALLRGFWQGQ